MSYDTTANVQEIAVDRRSRYERRHNKPLPPFGQSKNFHLSFAQDKKRILKYKIEYQTIIDKDGSTKRILHYRERDVSYGLKRA